MHGESFSHILCLMDFWPHEHTKRRGKWRLREGINLFSILFSDHDFFLSWIQIFNYFLGTPAEYTTIQLTFVHGESFSHILCLMDFWPHEHTKRRGKWRLRQGINLFSILFSDHDFWPKRAEENIAGFFLWSTFSRQFNGDEFLYKDANLCTF